ncbi:SDR family NAD(P)-dependent oxidoreductase [Arcticibacterium luteifluviistationis]|uniref:Oxidoreductase n=1 Tax=Arcticibacterium luteifluviistationis TaxID=1784714 RepID=A0A2Z4GBL4_9BACT|nr:SDR family oxidoreductase [Arcticibacterium luteifluviistationis]AWV98587.1 oxidoreductase [Arcticibacterium luteifluviistationis]
MSNFLVVGGSSGIGLALVEKLSKEGHKVYSTFNTNEKANFGNVSYQKLDVLNGVLPIDFLPESLDGFVYCPGSINLKPFSRFSAEDLIEDYKLQVVGATEILKSILPNLKKSKNASVLFFSTIAVQQGFSFHSQISASKGALEGLTRALAAELAPIIRVNAIAPSLTETPLSDRLINSEAKKDAQAEKNPMRRIGSVDDITEAAAFLLSDKSSWITGQILHIDGGLSAIKF